MCKKQVAIITPSKFPGTDGSTANFSEMINQFTKEGLKVLLICPKSPEEHNGNPLQSSPSLKITRIPCRPPRLVQIRDSISLRHYLMLLVFLITELFTVLWTLSSKKIHYVFIRHSILTMQLPPLLKLMGVKMIADGELLNDSGISGLNDSIFSRLILIYEKHIVKMYPYFKVTTQGQAETMEKWGFSKERILKFPISINLDVVPRFPIEEIPEHTFGYFGVLELWQGLDVLVEAFRILHKRVHKSTLYIIGDGSMKDQLKEFVSRNNLSSNVIFVNGIPRETLWYDYFNKFRIVIIPRPRLNSSVDFILPIKLVESLAGGKPVIATDISVMREIPGSPIVLTPSGDPMMLAKAMEELSSSSTKLKEYSQRVLSSASNFDIKVNIKKLIKTLAWN